MNEPKTCNPAPLPLPEAFRRRSVRANYSWTLVGNIVFAFCQWGMLAVLARIGSSDAVGQFALGLAIATPVIMLTNMQLRQLQATDARRNYAFTTYFGLRLLASSIGYLLIVMIVFWASYDKTTSLVILLLGLARLIDSLSDICYGQFQQYEQMHKVGRSMVLRGILSVLMLALTLRSTDSVIAAVLSLVLVWFMIWLFHDMRHSIVLLRRDVNVQSRRASRAELWQLITMALPLGVVLMLGTLNTTIPRYFIEYQLGTEALGVFAAIAYLMVAGNMVVGAMGQALAPRLASNYAAGHRDEFRRLSRLLIAGGAILGGAGYVLALLGGKQLLTLLYGVEYARLDVLLAVMLAAGCWYIASCGGFIATASRRISAQPLVLGAVVVISLGLCWWLVPLAGLRGAALAMACSSAAGAAGYGLLIAPVLRRRGEAVDG